MKSEIRNPKFEYRNPKPRQTRRRNRVRRGETISKLECLNAQNVLNFEFWSFEFVSDLEI